MESGRCCHLLLRCGRGRSDALHRLLDEREVRDLHRLAVFENLEVVPGQVHQGLAVVIGDGHVDVDDIDVTCAVRGGSGPKFCPKMVGTKSTANDTTTRNNRRIKPPPEMCADCTSASVPGVSAFASCSVGVTDSRLLKRNVPVLLPAGSCRACCAAWRTP